MSQLLLATWIVLLAFIAVVVMVPVRVDFRYDQQAGGLVRLEVSAVRRWLRYRTVIDLPGLSRRGSRYAVDRAVQAGQGSGRRKWRLPAGLSVVQLGQLGAGLFRVGRRFLKGLNLYHFAWSTRFGLGDPALTGAVHGLLWMLKTGVYGLLRENVQVRFNVPQFTVIPDFSESGFAVEVHCIFGFRLGHIIITGWRLGWLLIKFSLSRAWKRGLMLL